MGNEIDHARCNNDPPGARQAGPSYTGRSIDRLGPRCCGDLKSRSQGSVVVTRNSKEKKKEQTILIQW